MRWGDQEQSSEKPQNFVRGIVEKIEKKLNKPRGRTSRFNPWLRSREWVRLESSSPHRGIARLRSAWKK
jgi:hypothetical protein